MSLQFATNKAAQYIVNNAEEIEVMNRVQLSVGKDANDQELGDYGKLRTGQRLLAGKQVEFIDLNFTGEFYSSIEARGELRGKEAVLAIDSMSAKWDDISQDDRFKNALGLNEKDRDKVGYMIAEHLQKELTKYYSV